MTVEFKLPDLGEGLHEAEIVSVKVKEGEEVKEDQIIFEVETDKAVIEIPSPYAGTVAKLHAAAGQTVAVGSVLITYNVAGKTGAPAKEVVHPEVAEVAETGSAGNGKSAAPVKEVVAAAARLVEHDRSRPVPATPATRRLARELGVDLYTVAASGPAGRVLKEDVMAYAQGSLERMAVSSPVAAPHTAGTAATSAPSKTSSMQDKFGGSDKQEGGGGGPLFKTQGLAQPFEYPDFSKWGKVDRLPLKSIRRKIAINMTQAWTHIPHVTHFDEANVTELVAMLPRYEKEFAERSGNPRVRPTLTVLAIKAIVSALKLYPQFNSSLDENTGEIVVKHYYNIGVAVATERGLIVPVIKDADQKSFFDIAVELADIAAKTRAGKIELERLAGGTFTLTNIGAIGGTSMSPMVNFPEAAILGMAKAAEKPIVKDGQIQIGTILPLAMSFDHRLADGAEAAYFVQHIVKLLEDPFKFVMSA